MPRLRRASSFGGHGSQSRLPSEIPPNPGRLIVSAINSEEPTNPATGLWPPDSPITAEMLDYYKVRAHLLRTQALADMAAPFFKWVASSVKWIVRG